MLAAPPVPNVLQLLSSDLRWQLVSALARSDRQVHELVRFVGQPANLVSYHLRKLRSEHLVTERRSSADARDVYYSLDLDRLRNLYLAAGDALHPGLSVTETRGRADVPAGSPVRVLFLCTHNSARSQMAEALMRLLGGDGFEVFSAGSEPSIVHPDAIMAMARLNIDISGARAKHLDQYADEHFDYIVTVCDRVRETCPAFPNDPQRIHWSFADPTLIEDPAQRRQEFEQIAIQLQTRIRYLLTLIERDRRQIG
jgi:protein-tyrosine-phosphatase/DNA-binding transcriptional ArsR family regulator